MLNEVGVFRAQVLKWCSSAGGGKKVAVDRRGMRFGFPASDLAASRLRFAPDIGVIHAR